jgi:hypothetical protein
MELLIAKFLHIYFWAYIVCIALNIAKFVGNEDLQKIKPLNFGSVLAVTLWVMSWAY